MSQSLFFSGPKAPRVAALRVGDVAQTWRAIKLPGEAQWWQCRQRTDCGLPQSTWNFTRRVDGELVESLEATPRYRPGSVYHVGLPHRRFGKDTQQDQVYIPAVQGIVRRDDPNRISLTEITGVEWSGHMQAGYVLPGWGALQWALILSAEPQRLGDVTEAQAVAELVERYAPAYGVDRLTPEVLWRDYRAANAPSYSLPTARDSFLTMVDAVHGKPVDRQTWGWRYTVRMVEQPAEAEAKPRRCLLASIPIRVHFQLKPAQAGEGG